MQGTYISDYISEKVVINKDTGFTESNVEEILANVDNYNKVMEEFRFDNQTYDNSGDILVNKDIEKLKNDMRSKLDAFRKDNYIGQFKLDSKTPTSYDDTIKRMADELVRVVNSQNFNNKNNMNANDKKKK